MSALLYQRANAWRRIILSSSDMTGTVFTAELIDYRKGKSIIILDRLVKRSWATNSSCAYPYVHLHNFSSVPYPLWLRLARVRAKRT